MPSKMGVNILTYLALLLLTMFPLGAIAGRKYLPGAGQPGSPTTHTTPRVLQVAAARLVARGGASFGDNTQLQDRSPPPPRKLLRGFQGFQEGNEGESGPRHRLLVGSSPPTCQGKCGHCIPCSPIHVSYGSPHHGRAHQGAFTQQEYYPEVWRCKCGNQYFIP